MSRTNIEIDDELVGEVMRRYGLGSKREAVDFALRKAAPRITPEDIDALRGIGWEGDLEQMRRGTDPEHKWCST
jgi:Arc/MetJ family transcription regulator